MRHIKDPMLIDLVEKFDVLGHSLIAAREKAANAEISFCGNAERWEDCLTCETDLDTAPIFMFYYNIGRDTGAVGFKLDQEEQCLSRYY